MRSVMLGLLIVCAGCAGRYVTPSPVRPGTITSSPSDGIRVMESADAVFGSAKYTGSGHRLAGRVVQALQGQYVDVGMIATTREPDALQAARAEHAKYLIVPTILHWEDRNTAWSMNPDRLRVQLALRDVASDRVDRSGFELVIDSGGGLFGPLIDSDWKIKSQDPAAGTKVAPGSTIHVDIEQR